MKIQRLTEERDAFIADNQKISEILHSAGLKQYKNVSPGQQVKYLVEEVEKLQTETESAKQQLDSKQRDLEESMYQARKKTNKLEKELEQRRELFETQTRKMQEEKEKLEASHHTLQDRESSLRVEIAELKKTVVSETNEIKGKVLDTNVL